MSRPRLAMSQIMPPTRGDRRRTLSNASEIIILRQVVGKSRSGATASYRNSVRQLFSSLDTFNSKHAHVFITFLLTVCGWICLH